MRIRFALVTEGSSDRGLVPHLEDLCERAGATEVEGTAPDLGRLPDPPGKRVIDQVRAVLALVPQVQIVFIHRDADQRIDTRARHEIEAAITKLDAGLHHVAVVPIQELEAWLLTNEYAIREMAMNPRGTAPLGLPSISQIERAASPKELLQEALVAACKLSGRRLAKFEQDFPRHRGTLLERLDIDGEVRRLSAWQRLVRDTTTTVQALISRSSTEIPGR